MDNGLNIQKIITFPSKIIHAKKGNINLVIMLSSELNGTVAEDKIIVTVYQIIEDLGSIKQRAVINEKFPEKQEDIEKIISELPIYFSLIDEYAFGKVLEKTEEGNMIFKFILSVEGLDPFLLCVFEEDKENSELTGYLLQQTENKNTEVGLKGLCDFKISRSLMEEHSDKYIARHLLKEAFKEIEYQKYFDNYCSSIITKTDYPAAVFLDILEIT